MNTNTHISVPINTIRELARQAAVAMTDAEARLAKAEREVAKARELAALTDGLLQAAYTEQAVAMIAAQQPAFARPNV